LPHGTMPFAGCLYFLAELPWNFWQIRECPRLTAKFSFLAEGGARRPIPDIPMLTIAARYCATI
jgi:hypothetical protein